VIEGRVVHKVNNALKMTFTDGPGDPFGVGVQGAGDGKGSKLAILFGFKNGGVGKHLVTYTDGTVLGVESKSSAASVFTRNGSPLATVDRGESSTARGADGAPIVQIVADSGDDAKSVDAYRTLVKGPEGEDLGRLDVIRSVNGWSLDSLMDLTIRWDRAGEPLPVPILGARVSLYETPDATLRDVLVGACVDIAIGLRPYVAAMR
jgi:hypothetical protein